MGGTHRSTPPPPPPAQSFSFKPTVAAIEREDVPRASPISRCRAGPWVRSIKTKLAQCRPPIPPNAVDLVEWIVVNYADEKKHGAIQ